jgi:SHAQKYF class myb-like DNA-binding protein
MTSSGKDEEEMASTVAAAAAAAVEATASSATETMAAATTAAMGIMMMDPSMSTNDDGVEEGVVAPGMESTGRWTKQEHNKFLQGIEKYGKEWKKVAAFVRTRTVMQTRTHAQKFYEKLSQVALKATGTPLPSKSTSAKPIAMTQFPTLRPSAAATSLVPPKKLPGVVPSSFVHHGANSATLVVPPIPVVSFTELDILVPINDATASRPSNKIYMDMMKMNCFIFHSLPITEQLWFARNIVHFLSSVRRHRWIGCNYYGTAPQYQLLNEPVSVVQSDFRMDPLKVAAFAFHPLWLLGDHDIHKAHNGNPFIHRTVDGTWKHVTMAQVKDILNGEGPKNLLLLPSSIPAMEPAVAVPATTALKAPPTTVEETVPVTTNEEDTKVEAVPTEADADVEEDDTDKKEAEDEILIEEPEETPVAAVTKKSANKSKALPMAASSTPSKRSTTGTAKQPAPPPPSEEKQRRTKRSKV